MPSKNKTTSDEEQIPIGWLIGILSAGLIGWLIYVEHFQEPPPNRPESFAVHKTETINNIQLFSVNRISWGQDKHFYWSDYDKNKLFRNNLPSQIGLNLFSTTSLLGGSGIGSTHTAYAISQDTKTRFTWQRDLANGAKRSSRDVNELIFDNATKDSVSIKYRGAVLPIVPGGAHAVMYLRVGEHHFEFKNQKGTIEINVTVEDSNPYLFYLENIDSANSYRILSGQYKLKKK